MQEFIDVTAVEVVRNHVLRLTFENGLVGDVDFSGRQWRNMSAPLADPTFFARAYVNPEMGTVAWPNGYDVAPETLYERASEHPVQTPAASAAA